MYFGKQIRDKEDFSYFLEMSERPMSSCIYENDRSFSLEHIRQRAGTDPKYHYPKWIRLSLHIGIIS